MSGFDRRIETVLGERPARVQPLSGGCVGEVYGVTMSDNRRFVAKVDASPGGALDIEGFMLRFLKAHLPVPEVVFCDAQLLLMEWLPGSSSFDAVAERHAGHLLATLHSVTADHVGLERDTLIGGLRQPNPMGASWLTFFAEHRLIYMAREAFDHGRIDQGVLRDVEGVAGRLGRWLDEPDRFSLLHGDVWSGNVLAESGAITGFLDPAIYFGHREVELAFITMFSTFGDAFFRSYGETFAVDGDFFAVRRHLYNLYPYLVHVRLFGGSYLQSVKSIVRRF